MIITNRLHSSNTNRKKRDLLLRHSEVCNRVTILLWYKWNLFQRESRWRRVIYFRWKEIIMSCPNGKSSGCDGVKYEDLKSSWNIVGLTLVDIFNISMLNYKISSSWKHALTNRTPKKDFNEADLSTLRDISLLPTVYKIFSKAICQRLLRYVSDRIPFWQRAYLRKRDRQELIFSLKTAIDDFKRTSTKCHVVFIDFADAFGSVKHPYMFETLQELGIPYSLLRVIEDIYK